MENDNWNQGLLFQYPIGKEPAVATTPSIGESVSVRHEPER